MQLTDAAGNCHAELTLTFTLTLYPGADWAAWHLSGGSVGPLARWAATSNVEVGPLLTEVG